jgi:hypothetical protein
MRIALRLGVVSLLCVACESIGWNYAFEIKTYGFLAPRPAVDESMVQVFWFSPPDAPFDVLGRMKMSVRVREPLDRLFVARHAAKAAAKRGADVVWFQSDTIQDDWELGDCRYLEGVIGRRRE